MKGRHVLRSIDGIDPGFRRNRFAQHRGVVAAVQGAETWARAAKTLFGVRIDGQETHYQGVTGFGALHIERTSERIWTHDFKSGRFKRFAVSIHGGCVDDISRVNAHDWW